MQSRYSSLIENQRQFFSTGTTLPVEFRLQQLRKLQSLVETHQTAIAQALKKDLNKAPFEAYVNETMLVLDEIRFIIKRLKKWAAPKKTATPFPFLWPGHSSLHYEPYGCTLIIGPWNYPFLLILSPLMGAIAAGNCAIVKPSELAPHTEALLVELLNQHFEAEYVKAIQAGPEEVDVLLKERFDYIFFTGGTRVGKIIMQAAAEQLTPVTLELGGKSPCIVDETANLDYAARRIAWAKTINAGQVCIAPDYLYVQRTCKEVLVQKLQAALETFYGRDAELSDSYSRIINEKHFERLTKLMQQATILYGGKSNAETRYIQPTLLDRINWQSPIMQEEIFGPLLPILTFDKLDDIIPSIKAHGKPLALYLFTKSKQNEQKILQTIPFGGGCVNDCILQVANPNLPFGGVGASGIGRYHGRYSFETFSHAKGIYKKTFPIDFKLEYPPYSATKLALIRLLLRL